jgi:uncharacterized protein YecT (DUF1311 family)
MHTEMQVVLRAILVSGFFIVAAQASGAIPGQPHPDDVQTIDACMANASKSNVGSDTCIGQVTGACLKSAPASAAIKQCSDREYLVWDAALNRDSATLMGFLVETNVKQALRDEQHDFIIGRLKRCTFERIAHKDSPDSLAAADLCNVKATAREELWVLEQISSFKPH